MATLFASSSLILLTIYLLTLKDKRVDGKLQSFAVIFRHGDRNPAIFYPKFSQSPFANHWKDSEVGQLTERGKKRARTLGRVISKFYGKYVSDRVTLTSSPTQRCRDSLEYFLQSFTNSTLPAVIVDPSYSLEASCPKRRKMLLEPDWNEEDNIKHRALFKHVDHHQGFKSGSAIYRTFATIDTYRIMKEQGLQPPHWITKGIFDTLLKYSVGFFRRLSYDSQLIQLTLGTTFNDLHALFNGSLNSDMYVQSTHDINILFLLNSLGIYSDTQSLHFDGGLPGYSSAVIIELHAQEDSQKYVKLFMLKDPLNPHLTEIHPHFCPSTGHCSLDSFYRETNRFALNGNWSQECAAGAPTHATSFLSND